jgi:hypothetical protein
VAVEEDSAGELSREARIREKSERRGEWDILPIIEYIRMNEYRMNVTTKGIAQEARALFFMVQ